MADQTLSVREQLFLLAHDEYREFRPRIHMSALGIGLAGANLIDLIYLYRVGVAGTRAVIADLYDTTLTGDPVQDHVLTIMRQVRPTPSMRDLLIGLGPEMYDRTLGGLLAAGVVVPTRRWMRSGHQAADLGRLAAIRGSIRYRANGQKARAFATDALCVLVSALDLHSCLVFDLTDREVDVLLQRVIAEIPVLASRTEQTAPLAAVPEVGLAVRDAVAELANAVYR